MNVTENHSNLSVRTESQHFLTCQYTQMIIPVLDVLAVWETYRLFRKTVLKDTNT